MISALNSSCARSASTRSALSVDDLIVPNVEVKGVSAYMKDTMEAHVNLFI